MNLQDVKQAQEGWFSSSNKRFSGDISYKVLHDKAGVAYFVRKTNAWTDMFGKDKRAHYRVNELNQETCKIGHLFDDEFETLDDVKDWLRGVTT